MCQYLIYIKSQKISGDGFEFLKCTMEMLIQWFEDELEMSCFFEEV